MNDLFKNINISIIDTISIEAELSGKEVYLVGGFVRDLILNRKNKDIDVMVVGNGIDFAKLISNKLINAVGELPITIIGDFTPKFLADNSIQPFLCHKQF